MTLMVTVEYARSTRTPHARRRDETRRVITNLQLSPTNGEFVIRRVQYHYACTGMHATISFH